MHTHAPMSFAGRYSAPVIVATLLSACANTEQRQLTGPFSGLDYDLPSGTVQATELHGLNGDVIW